MTTFRLNEPPFEGEIVSPAVESWTPRASHMTLRFPFSSYTSCHRLSHSLMYPCPIKSRVPPTLAINLDVRRAMLVEAHMDLCAFAVIFCLYPNLVCAFEQAEGLRCTLTLHALRDLQPIVSICARMHTCLPN